jgi:hypothetical protein
MVDRSNSSAEMRTPAILSVGVHAFAIVAAVANFNFFSPPPMEPEPVMVEFEAIAKKAAAPKVGIQEQQPEKAKIAEETSKAPPPRTADPPPAPEPKKEEVAEAVPVPPKPEEKKVEVEKPKPVEDKIALKPKEPEPPKVEKPPEQKPEPPKPEVKKEPPKPPVAPPPKPQPKKDVVDNIVDSILKNDDKNPPIKTPQQSPQRPKEITRQVAMAPEFAAVVTASEVEGVRQKIRPCWNSFGGAKDAPVVSLVVQMNPNGTPVDTQFKDPGRMGDPIYRAAAESARRAIMNPRCQPWPLSPEKYNSWRTITFNFDPRDY